LYNLGAMKVLVTGIFDLVHVEHVRFLAAAKNQGRGKREEGRGGTGCYLIVGIEADWRVKKLKGAGRPVMGQEDRKEMLQGLKMVDEVFIMPADFDNDEQYEKVLKDVGADVYAVSENSPFMENKVRICRKAGVVLKIVHGYNPEYSTTKLIDKLLNC